MKTFKSGDIITNPYTNTKFFLVGDGNVNTVAAFLVQYIMFNVPGRYSNNSDLIALLTATVREAENIEVSNAVDTALHMYYTDHCTYKEAVAGKVVMVMGRPIYLTTGINGSRREVLPASLLQLAYQLAPKITISRKIEAIRLLRDVSCYGLLAVKNAVELAMALWQFEFDPHAPQTLCFTHSVQDILEH